MRTALALVAAGALALGAHELKLRALAVRAGWPAAEEYVWLPPERIASTVYLGYRELAADVTWMRTLVYYGSSRIGASDFRYLERLIDGVLALDPHYRRVYEWAAYAVTYKQERATQEELLLSARYLERALPVFPHDYRLRWLLGLRYYLDLWSDDPWERRRLRERGVELIELAMRMPNAPPDLPTLAANLRSKLGQRQRAVEDLRSMIMTTDNPEAQAKMLRRFREIDQREDLARELEDATLEFSHGWRETLPYAPPGLYVLLGPRPEVAIDFDTLANERDLFGLEPAEEDLSADVDDVFPFLHPVDARPSPLWTD